jgi:hypothetical protein
VGGTALPDMATEWSGVAMVALAYGRTLMIGGWDGRNDATVHASVEILTVVGKRWTTVAPMSTPRISPAAAQLPSGDVIMAGGCRSRAASSTSLASAELWNSTTNTWSALPPMTTARRAVVGFVLPSGRFAVLGGWEDDGRRAHKDGEAFD